VEGKLPFEFKREGGKVGGVKYQWRLLLGAQRKEYGGGSR